MTNLILVLLAVLLAGCSTAHPRADSDSGSSDLSGRWTGKWTGAGLLMSYREEGVILDLVQRGDVAYGRIVVDGAGAAESVPVDIRWAGLGGVKVRADISGDKVTLRHDAGGQLFTADLKRTPDGTRLYGLVRGSHPPVAFVLSRVTEGTPAPPQAAMAPPVQTPKAEPPSVVAVAPEPKESPKREEGFVDAAELAPIHFDFDKADIRPGDAKILDANAAWLTANPKLLVLIEGHCDERGTAEYNLALGERRAKATQTYLISRGVQAERITTVSYGEERPACTEHTEKCWATNRRAQFLVKEP